MLRVNPVKGKGRLSVNIGSERVFRPCGINFIRGNIFDVVGEINSDISL